MSLPLLSTDYLSSPSQGGALPSKTAELYISQGEALAKTIEANSLKADAAIKAPIITGHYSDAYARIVSGDMTGFASMQKARELAVGNPLLTSVVDSADKIAGHLANTWLESEVYGKKSALDLNKTRIVQSDIADRQDKALATAAAREDTRTALALHREKYDEWEKTEFYTKKEEEKDLDQWHNMQAAEDVRASMVGETPRQLPPPPPRPHQPPPKFEPINSALPSANAPSELPSSAGGLLLFPDAPSRLSSSVKADLATAQAEHLQLTPDSLMAIGEKPIPTPKAVPADAVIGTVDPKAAKASVIEPLVNQTEPSANPKTISVPFGTMVWKISPKSQEPDKVSIDPTTGKASVTYTRSTEHEDLAGIINSFAGDEQFAHWMSMQARSQKKVTLVPGLVDKGKAEYYVAKSSDGTVFDRITPSAVEGQPGKATPIQFTEEQYKEWNKAQHLMTKANVKVEFPEIKVTGRQAEVARQIAMADAKANPAKLAEINASLKQVGMEPITLDTPAAPAATTPVAAPERKLTGADAELQKQIDAHAASEAQSAKDTAQQYQQKVDQARLPRMKQALTDLQNKADDVRSAISDLIKEKQPTYVIKRKRDELLSILDEADKIKNEIDTVSKA